MTDKNSAPQRAEPTYPISSVDNALRVLLLFRDHPQLLLSDVAREPFDVLIGGPLAGEREIRDLHEGKRWASRRIMETSPLRR